MKIQAVGIRQVSAPPQSERIAHAKDTARVQHTGDRVRAEKTRKALDGEGQRVGLGRNVDLRV